MHTKNDIPYRAFGTLLIELRHKAGIGQQSELATLVKSTQQTVSRWELGLSRPREKQMPLLASVLKADPNTLLAAAQYTVKRTVATFDQPFPIEALDPDSFERFCLHFLARLYPTADVHRVGGSGHTQEGLDVEVMFPDGTCYTFQCKRVEEFGPGKVHKAVKKHTREAPKKFLLLTRVASPPARKAIREHATWDIWDKEDISRIIRQELSRDDQRRLVDIFFHGQRLALLGETEPGPWQISDEFFAAFMSERGAFTHAWDLVGRSAETRVLTEELSNSHVQAVYLIGAGGAGKSRILKQVIEAFASARKDVLVRFLSPSGEPTLKSLEDLGNGKKVLVVDDAHEIADLRLLFQYAAISGNTTTLLLALRPYGLDYIKDQASKFALLGERVAEVTLQPLTLGQATELATQVLKAFNGPEEVAPDIAHLTLDCPLATVIGAQVVAKEHMYLDLAKNKEDFRATLLGKFRDIIAGDIGKKSDTDSMKKLLRVLSLLQPFHPEDESIAKVIGQVEGLHVSHVNRLIRLLIEAGVLFKRGGQYRLSPDVLADYIIEDACIGHNGTSTGYAEQVFDAAHTHHLEHILLNLGKLDWCRANGDPSHSRLLDGIWRKLKPAEEYADPYISAVTAVACYQPARTLTFAEDLIRQEQYLHGLPTLIKYAAYNLDYVLRACECLWELGKDDKRALHQHPGHAIRILTEMCAVKPDKPIAYNEAVVDFGMDLLTREDAWGHAYSPWDILKGILQPEGYTSSFNGRGASLSPFLVSASVLSELRCKVMNAAIGLLTHPSTKIAVLAAHFLQDGLRYPGGMFGIEVSEEMHEAWTNEFVQTLEKIKTAVKTEELDHIVLIEIIRSIAWHVNYGPETTAPVAKQIITLLPDSLEFRTSRALIDGYGQLLLRADAITKDQQEWNTYLNTLANDLISTYYNGEGLRTFIEQHLSHIESSYVARNISPYILYARLIESSSPLAQATVEHALKYPASHTAQFAGTALSKLLNENYPNGLSIALQFFETNSCELHTAIGHAYSILDLKWSYTEEDMALLRKIFASTDHWVLRNAIGAVRTLAKQNQRLALDLLKCVDIGISCEIADDVLVLFQHDDIIPFNMLTEDDITHLLNKIMRLPELNGYWVEVFLSNVSVHHAQRAASFFLARVEHAVNTQDWHYRPCNYGPYSHVPLRFRESPEFGRLLRQVSVWLKSRRADDYLFRIRAGELFDAMFRPFDNELIGYLQDWIDGATAADMPIISQILSEASPDFVFERQSFAVRFLEKAKQFGKEPLDDALSALFKSAIKGIKEGIPGEPFPQDIQLKEKAEKVIGGMPRFSPAYRLYEALKKHAEQGIEFSLHQREAWED